MIQKKTPLLAVYILMNNHKLPCEMYLLLIIIMFSLRCLRCDQSLRHSFPECAHAPLWSHTEQLYVNTKLFVMRLVCGVCNTTKSTSTSKHLYLVLMAFFSVLEPDLSLAKL